MVMRIVDIPVDKVYVPSSKSKTLDLEKVEPLAEDILENGLQNPIYVREGKDRFVLQEGLHRLEAVKLLGEDTIEAKIVQAKKA
jgi:ParB-like chromosome segregation protein Spo0J